MSTRRGPLATLFLTVFMDLVGFGIVLPLLAHYAEDWGASALAIGFLFASFSLMQFLLAPLWGRLSDRIGRRPVILISLAGSVISYALFAWASVIHSLPLLFASRILAGAMGANIPVAQAYIADTTSAEGRAHGMGLIGAAFGLGFIFGPALGGLFLLLGTAGPGLGAAAICAVNLLMAVRGLPESLAVEHRRTGGGPNHFKSALIAMGTPGRRGLLWMFFLITISMGIWETTLPMLCLLRFGWGEGAMPWVYTYAGLLGAFVQGYLVRRLRRWIAEAPLIVMGSFIAMVGLAGIATSHAWWVLGLALAAYSLGMGMSSPSVLGLLSRRCSPSEQGEIMGVSQSLSSLARVLGPLVGYGLIFGVGAWLSNAAASPWDEASPFLFATGLALIVWLAALGLRREKSATV